MFDEDTIREDLYGSREREEKMRVRQSVLSDSQEQRRVVESWAARKRQQKPGKRIWN